MPGLIAWAVVDVDGSIDAGFISRYEDEVYRKAAYCHLDMTKHEVVKVEIRRVFP